MPSFFAIEICRRFKTNVLTVPGAVNPGVVVVVFFFLSQ